MQSRFVVSIEDHLTDLKDAIGCAHAFHIGVNEAKGMVLISCSHILRDSVDISLNVTVFFSIVDKSHIIYLHEVHSQDISVTKKFKGI